MCMCLFYKGLMKHRHILGTHTWYMNLLFCFFSLCVVCQPSKKGSLAFLFILHKSVNLACIRTRGTVTPILAIASLLQQLFSTLALYHQWLFASSKILTAPPIVFLYSFSISLAIFSPLSVLCGCIINRSCCRT